MTLYWIKEYIFVLLAYGMVMFLWPMVVFREYLKGKSLKFRVVFGPLFMITATNILVLSLGLMHILNVWIVRALFYGVLIFSLVYPYIRKKGRKVARRTVAVLSGGYKGKSLATDVSNHNKFILNRTKDKIKRKFNNNWVLYVLFAIMIIYGMIYFGQAVITSHSFGTSDMYVHNEWAYSLVEGKVFSGGIYPEGMHTIIYLMHIVTGVKMYSLILYLQPVHIALFLVSLFIFCEEFFGWRYTGLLVMAVFLILDATSVGVIYSMSRLQWTIPQEFGMFAVFLCPAFLCKYMREYDASQGEQKENVFKKIIRNQNLIIFAMSLMTTIVVHFYCTIIAFFMCLCVVLVHLKKFFNKKILGRLFLTIVIMVAVSVIPMGVGYLEGIKMQGSLKWAQNVMDGTAVFNPGLGSIEEIEIDTDISAENLTLNERIQNWLYLTYYKTFTYIFGLDRAKIVLVLYGIAFVSWLFLSIAIQILNKYLNKNNRGLVAIDFSGTVCITLMAWILTLMQSARSFGLPQLVEGNRLCYMETITTIGVGFVFLDLVFSVLNIYLKNKADWMLALYSVAAVIILVITTGHYHGTLYTAFTRYNSAVNTTVNIINTNEKDTFTIISPVDEIYQVASYGRHEELFHFVNKIMDESYKLPTENVYLYIEKHPLLYAQYHFPVLPKWLADSDKSLDFAEDGNPISVGDTYIYDELNREWGENIREYIPEHNAMYSYVVGRVLIESRAENWIKDFKLYYPNAMSVYYEDEDFICYQIKQNPNAPYDLALQEVSSN